MSRRLWETSLGNSEMGRLQLPGNGVQPWSMERKAALLHQRRRINGAFDLATFPTLLCCVYYHGYTGIAHEIGTPAEAVNVPSAHVVSSPPGRVGGGTSNVQWPWHIASAYRQRIQQ